MLCPDTGSGPAVIVMTEMPGISPQVARFARWVRDAGFTVYMPSLFGRDGAVPIGDFPDDTEQIGVEARLAGTAIAIGKTAPLAFRDLANGAHPGSMAERAGHAPLACPPPVPVHDDRHVPRHRAVDTDAGEELRVVG